MYVRSAAWRWRECYCLTGCTTGKQGGDTGAASAGASGGSGKASSNVLRYALIAEPTTLDPATVQDGTTIDLLQNVFEGLVKWDEKNNIVPSLAEKWDLSPDGDDVYFSSAYGHKIPEERARSDGGRLQVQHRAGLRPGNLLLPLLRPAISSDIQGAQARLNA